MNAYKKLRNALRRERFREWLLREPESETVGLARNAVQCPIACYLADTLGLSPVSGPTPRVLSTVVCLVSPGGRGMGSVSPPDWVRAFIALVDRRPQDAEITAAEALAYLSQAEASAGQEATDKTEKTGGTT